MKYMLIVIIMFCTYDICIEIILIRLHLHIPHQHHLTLLNKFLWPRLSQRPFSHNNHDCKVDYEY